MDIVVPVPHVRRCGSAMSPPLRERPGLPLATVGFARPSYPSLASARPVGFVSPLPYLRRCGSATRPPLREPSWEVQHCPGCCCLPASEPPCPSPAPIGHPNLPRGVTAFYAPNNKPPYSFSTVARMPCPAPASTRHCATGVPTGVPLGPRPLPRGPMLCTTRGPCTCGLHADHSPGEGEWFSPELEQLSRRRKARITEPMPCENGPETPATPMRPSAAVDDEA
jgi:hypothetical protein